ncbi:hypothetical protein QJS04_geneDACA012261 [Acorus gramineus]|uniref:Uncharacterized protein n=1 Tax=Acorus gramineus TaxID=55184 RepID=A0AAV9BDQ0_ACOGR|nr:hypothetical protein QJS04_geneDACA012261 [Acorus gramineus]
MVNEKNRNPTWKAIDYCGPDPNTYDSSSLQTEEEKIFGPLNGSIVVDLGNPTEVVRARL